jgi:hypothetical protein
MNIYTFKKFLEANIDLPELRDPKRGMPPRGNILVKKLKDGEELQVGTKKVVVDKMAQFIDTPTGVSASWVEPEEGVSQIIQPSGAYDPNKADKYFKYKNKYRNVFKDENDFEFKLDQIFKTKDFGSKGPGGDTSNFESIQAIFVAIKVDDPLTVLKPDYDKKIDDDDPLYFLQSDRAIMRSYKKFLDDGGLDDVKLSPNIQINYNTLEKYLSDKHWVSTFCDVPNRLYDENETKKYIDPSIKYITYHTGYKGADSPYINLVKKYRELSKSGNAGLIDGTFTDIDYSKWCPADIYLVDKKLITSLGDKEEEPNINIEISKVTTMYDLVNVVERFFIPKQFIPISLKKVKQSAKFKIITNAGRGVNLPEFEIVNFRINADSIGIGSKISTQSEWKFLDEIIDERDRVINFDSSDTSKSVNIDGEVEGSSSKHGKISLNYINRSIASVFQKKNKSMGGLNVKTYAEIKSDLSKQKDPNQALQGKIKDISDEIIKLSNSNPTLKGLLSIVKVTRGTDTNGNINAGISRYQSLQVIYLIMKAYSIDAKFGNLIITKIMRYALSIQTEYFNTPMYLRVI